MPIPPLLTPKKKHKLTKGCLFAKLSHHFPLLLLLVLQLYGHQSVVELGDLSPHHLNLIVNCQSLNTLRPQRGVSVHTASPLYPVPGGPQPSYPAVADIPDEVVPVLRSGGGGVVGNLAELDGSKNIKCRHSSVVKTRFLALILCSGVVCTLKIMK